MVVAAARLELEIPAARSLKDKRRVVRGLVDRLRRRFGAACAEVDRLDDPGRAVLAVAVVTNDRQLADRMIQHIVSWLEVTPEAVLSGYDWEFR